MIEKQTGQGNQTQALGGPHSVSLEEMLHEIEENTEIGKQFVTSFAQMRKEFPSGPEQPSQSNG